LVSTQVDGALLGTAATGLYFAQRSRVPWCVASVDVGFAPLLAQLAELCWNEIVGFNGTYGRPWSFGADRGGKRARHAQLQRLLSRPFSTRFG